jgi:hypothetical protein
VDAFVERHTIYYLDRNGQRIDTVTPHLDTHEVIDPIDVAMAVAMLPWAALAAATRAAVVALADTVSTKTAVFLAARFSAGVTRDAEGPIAEDLVKFLAKNSGGSIRYGRIEMGGVRVFRDGADLVVQRDMYVNLDKILPGGKAMEPPPLDLTPNPSKIPGAGSLVQKAFEKAAIRVARQEGATGVRIELGTVQNQRWAGWLQRAGYSDGQYSAHAFADGTTRSGGGLVLVKAFKVE